MSYLALDLEMPLALHPGYLGNPRQLESLFRVWSFPRKISSLNFGIY